MRKFTTLLLVMLAAATLPAQNMKAFISHKAYCTDKMQPYIEFTFIIGGNSVRYALNEHQKFEADVDVRVDVAKGDSVVKTLHYILSSEEALQTLSGARLGVDMNMFSSLDIHTVNELFVAINPAHLQKLAGRALQGPERDIFRAQTVRELLRRTGSN